MNDESNPARRREFLRETLAHAVGPLANFLDKQLGLGSSRTLLRPPGALPEPDFLKTCLRCGECVSVCPAKAIFPWNSHDPRMHETPVIAPDESPCVVCEGLECMKACPSGALRLVAAPGLIRMGVAVVNEKICVRSQGQNCTICVDHCPIGSAALVFDGPGPPRVLDPGCVGCGVCQHDCPTKPKAIVVHAR